MRIDGWPQRLHATCMDWWLRPFAWGSADCVSFARACVHAVTGADPINDLEWHDEKSALRALQAVGGIAAWLDDHYPPVDPARALRGDLGLMVQEDRVVLNVCTGAGWAAPSDHGLAITPLEDIDRAWAVR